MSRIPMVLWTILFSASAAFSQNDTELLEKVRANAAKIYLEQASFTLPKSFHTSGLAPSDKKKIIKRWANESAICHVDALAAYAATNDVPLSELIHDDGTYGFGYGVPTDWDRHLKTCLALTWEAVGATLLD